MKANEFVKRFGWDVSIKLSREMRGITESVADGVAGWGQSEWDKLKRLVESHELVEECGGLDKAKERVALEEKLLNPNVFYVLVVSSAIDDVESCQ